jgi:hypothetical protein
MSRWMRRAFISLTTGIVIALVTPRADADTGAQELASVPGGSFMMGDVEGDPNEASKPATVAAFMFMRLEVTNRQFAAFVTATGHCTNAEKRGGGWGNNQYCLRVSYRHGNLPDIGLDRSGSAAPEISRNEQVIANRRSHAQFTYRAVGRGDARVSGAGENRTVVGADRLSRAHLVRQQRALSRS